MNSGGVLLVVVVMQGLHGDGEPTVRFFSCSFKASQKKQKKKLLCWKNQPRSTRYLPLEMFPRLTSAFNGDPKKQRRRRRMKEKKRDRSRTRMPMFPFFLFEKSERRRRRVTSLAARRVVTGKKEKRETESFFFSPLLSAGVSLRSQQS